MVYQNLITCPFCLVSDSRKERKKNRENIQEKIHLNEKDRKIVGIQSKNLVCDDKRNDEEKNK